MKIVNKGFIKRRMLLFVFICSIVGVLFNPEHSAGQFKGKDNGTQSGPVVLNSSSLFQKGPDHVLSKTIQIASPQVIPLLVQSQTFATMRSNKTMILQDFPLPNGAEVDLDVRQFSVFADDAVIVAMTPFGEVRRPIPDITLYKGTIRGEIGSWVYLAVENNAISGTIVSHGTEYTLYMDESQSFQGGSTPVLYVFLTTNDMRVFECGVTEDEIMQALDKISPPAGFKSGTRDTLMAYIAVDADYESFQHYKGVTQTENYITARMGESSAIYERDVAISLSIPYMRVWETTDPFQGSSDRELLNVFGKYWKENMGHIDRTLAVMISRKPISAPGVSQGLAWLDKLCSKDLGYSFVKFSSNNNFTSGHTGVLAHELGHNFGSPHTHSCWWNPPIDSCYTAEPVQGKPACFSDKDKHLILGGGEMMSYCHMTYGNNAKYNIFRERVGALVRNRADAALCINSTSSVRNLKLLTPQGGESLCGGSQLDITWDASGTNDFSILLSRNGGQNYDTVLVTNLERQTRNWTWDIPGNFTPGTKYRIRIKDNRNETLVDQMNADFEIKPGTYIVNQVHWRNVCVGEGANFNVTAVGPGTLRYQWKKNGVDLPGKTEANLQLENITIDDNGSLFTCYVAGDCGSDESEPALLKVFSSPIIVKQPNNDTVCVGGTATLRIEAEGPELTYKWVTLGQVFEVNSPEFEIKNVQESKGYYCEISSPCGKVNTKSGFVVIPTPSASFQSPKPFEQLTAGGKFDILWKQWCLKTLKIEYSTNGGSPWNLITASVPAGDGKYTWNIPVIETTTGSFKLTDNDTPTRTVISPTFHIKKRPTIVLSSDEVNFGWVGAGTTATKTITISNQGIVDLDVTSTQITGTTDVTVVNGAPFSVPPSQSYDLNFEYKPLISGPLTGYVDIAHNALGSPTKLPLVGDAFVVTSTGSTPKPLTLALYQNYPNPVSVAAGNRTMIAFDLPTATDVKITLYNALGKEIKTLVSAFRECGRHEVIIDVSDLPTGTYLYRLTAGGNSLSRVLQALK